MPVYRAYLLNAAGRITWGDWIDAGDLEEAKAKAAAMCTAGAPTVELWEGPKKLAQFDCGDDAPAPHDSAPSDSAEEFGRRA